MQQDFTSPDGRLKVEFQSNEMKMSHWIFSPRITLDGAILLDLWDPAAFEWDADATMEENGCVLLEMRKYPGDSPGVDVRIDSVAKTWSVVKGSCPSKLRVFLGRALREVGATST